MIFNDKIFMDEKLNSNNIESDKINNKSEELDYKNLISRLKEISKNIALLEKTIFGQI
jgi:hypothetical protein